MSTIQTKARIIGSPSLPCYVGHHHAGPQGDYYQRNRHLALVTARVPEGINRMTCDECGETVIVRYKLFDVHKDKELLGKIRWKVTLSGVFCILVGVVILISPDFNLWRAVVLLINALVLLCAVFLFGRAYRKIVARENMLERSAK